MAFFWFISGAPYANFAGHDATRGLATFSVDVSDKDYDDLSDLSAMEVDSAREWEMQFRGKVLNNCLTHSQVIMFINISMFPISALIP